MILDCGYAVLAAYCLPVQELVNKLLMKHTESWLCGAVLERFVCPFQSSASDGQAWCGNGNAFTSYCGLMNMHGTSLV